MVEAVPVPREAPNDVCGEAYGHGMTKTCVACHLLLYVIKNTAKFSKGLTLI